jgi:hypothetical protein
MQDINKALAFLSERGYEIGDSFVPPDGRIHVWVADRACAFEHIRMLVALENMKSAATGIDSSALTDLVGLCRQVYENSAVDSASATKALDLQTEWKILVHRGTPPAPSLADKKALDVASEALAARIVSFLAREIPNLSVLTRAHSG